jgi:putative CocE/NonD family hydrolase
MRHGGAFCLGTMVSWSLGSVASMALMRHGGSPEERDRLAAEWADAMDGMARGNSFSVWPPDDMPVIGRSGWASYLGDVYAHPARDAYWQAVACPREALDLPIFHIGGWYDIFAPNTSADIAAMSALGHTRQRLLMGPWVHGPFGENANGEVDFGVAASNSQVLLEEQQLRWFDHWLKDSVTDLSDWPPVRLFVMGVNRWRDEEEWPLRRARPTPYYLHSAGAANTLHGDGTLSPIPASEEPADAFLYEPRHPVPTRGGGLCCSQAALPPGAFDQRPIEERLDVLVYSTPPLDDDLEVTGDVIVRLWAATSAPTPTSRPSSWTWRLTDRNLCDGRGCYRSSNLVPRRGAGQSSWRATACGWRYRAATSPATTATPTPARRRALPAPRCRRSCTTPRIRAT